MSAARVDAFKQLLNEISHELNEKNLQSLIHLSDVPGALVGEIKNGIGLFTHLIQVGKISDDDVGFLRKLLRKMRPRRPSLVCLVDKYIKDKHNVDDVSHILGDLSDSCKVPDHDGHGDCQPSEQEVAFQLNCAYMNCVCRRFPSCLLPSVILMFLSVVITCIIWYGDFQVSKRINSDDDWKKAGVYIIIVECVVFMLLLGWFAWKCCARSRQGYTQFVNTTVQQQQTAYSTVSVEAAQESSQPKYIKQNTSHRGDCSVGNGGCSVMSGYASGAYSTDEGTD